ncbi:MAG: hypothetical protein B7Z35_09295 [Hydrogenophilales bacterium 12-61-10]|nr:MAG: hypothetical protein B7Z35_09295 [Hydrogenophilales bacterium 12-61-10]OYX29051.1 MAG: hypothetical protein B7Z03_10265 [Hydrogenophilales bacterium 32-62-9]
MTNAQRRAAWLASLKAETDSSHSDVRSESTPKPMPKPTASSAFRPHPAGAYYLAEVNTVGTFRMFAKDLKPPVYTYGITTVHFELNPDTGKWIWFDGVTHQSPRKTHDGWRLGSKPLHDTRESAEAELQREMVKNGDRVTKVHDLPDDMAALKKIRSANHPDRNAESDVELYQAVVEKLDRMRVATQ